MNTKYWYYVTCIIISNDYILIAYFGNTFYFRKRYLYRLLELLRGWMIHQEPDSVLIKTYSHFTQVKILIKVLCRAFLITTSRIFL